MFIRSVCRPSFHTFLLAVLMLFIMPSCFADYAEVVITTDEHDFTLNCFPASGKQMLLWVAPGFGTHERGMTTSEKIAGMGVEACHVDLADNLFIPKSTSSMRKLSGENLRLIIESLHAKTGKEITLLSRSYGALPTLKAMRLWQQARQQDGTDASYLHGAILFSPELYASIPPLGQAPVYDPIIEANTMPVMIYQAGKRSNRWQLDRVITSLSKHGANVFFRVQKGVTGTFYRADFAAETLQALKNMPGSLFTDIKLLRQLTTPLQTVSLNTSPERDGTGLDTQLTNFTADMKPHALDLEIVQGGRLVKNNYKGKLTVINFWATWCPPCVVEIPSLNRLRNKMQGYDFELISVNYSETRAHIRGFLEKVKVNFPVLLDVSGEISASWNVLVYPSTFVIGPDGKILYGINGAIEWDSDEVINRFKSILEEHKLRN